MRNNASSRRALRGHENRCLASSTGSHEIVVLLAQHDLCPLDKRREHRDERHGIALVQVEALHRLRLYMRTGTSPVSSSSSRKAAPG